MKLHKWSDSLAKSKLSPQRRARIEADVDQELLEMNLQELRKAAGITQAEMAALATTLQTDATCTESREDHRLSTLRPLHQGVRWRASSQRSGQRSPRTVGWSLRALKSSRAQPDGRREASAENEGLDRLCLRRDALRCSRRVRLWAWVRCHRNRTARSIGRSPCRC